MVGLQKKIFLKIKNSILISKVNFQLKMPSVHFIRLHLNHPGMVRMKSLARLHVWWPSLDPDVEQIVRNCANCQRDRISPRTSVQKLYKKIEIKIILKN